MNGQAASALPATPATNLLLVGPLEEALVTLARKRFEDAVQALLDAPLDVARVAEWTKLRALSV